MKRLFFISLLFLVGFSGFGQTSDQTGVAKEHLISEELLKKLGPSAEQMAYADSVCKTKIFLDKREEIEKLSKGDRSLSLHFTSKPTSSEPFYHYTARELIEGLPKNHLHFRAYPATNEIKLYDPATYKEYPIDK